MIATELTASGLTFRRIDDSVKGQSVYGLDTNGTDDSLTRRRITVSHKENGRSVSSLVRYDRKTTLADGTVDRDDSVWLVVKTAARRDLTSLPASIGLITDFFDPSSSSTPADFEDSFLQLDT